MYIFFAYLALGGACRNYNSLSDAERSQDYVSKYPKQCDSTLPVGWYRFQGAVGTQMATSCPPENRCDASFPAWMNGTHPTVAEGIVIRKVCIHKWGDCCREFVKIRVKNCGCYHIYKFFGLPGCDIRYCGTD